MSRFATRILAAQGEMSAAGIDALCLSVGSDLPYLTGYRAMELERMTMFVLHAEGDGTIVVPTLEAPRIDAEGIPISVMAWEEDEDPITIVDRLLGDATNVMMGDETWARFLIDLQRVGRGRLFVKASGLMANLRMVKAPDEIALLRDAAATVDGVVEQISELRFSGFTERELARDITERTLAGGHDTMDFWIVASGPNGASPHHEPGDRVIQHGDAVVVDFGGHQAGYASDTTRMFVVAEPPDGFDLAFDVLLAAQRAAVDHVRPCVTAESVDAVARSIIADGGYGDLFVHRTGHGIGLDGHEHPYLIAGNDMILREGMAFSIEPGIYTPGHWGMRIEDIVAVTSDGVERLNTTPRLYRTVA